MDISTSDRVSFAGEKETSHSHENNKSKAAATYDLDNPAVLAKSLHEIKAGNISNFVVDFNDESAIVQFNLEAKDYNDVVTADRADAPNTRWINIWYPYQQRGTLEVLAQRYDFSPRLLALMFSNPVQERRGDACPSSADRSSRWKWRNREDRSAEDKLEAGMDELADQASICSAGSLGESNIYWLLSDLWHYSSVDFGRSYVCVGYNTIYGTKHAGGEEGSGPLPHCTRVWTWLLLCEDSTVITINEDPFPGVEGELSILQQRLLIETRRNVLNVFRSLSKTDEMPLMTRNPLTVLPIRTRIGDTPEETAHREADAPGLLFYYLFENWQKSYSLVTRKESRYDVELQRIRQEMFQRPELGQVDRLDSIGKELGVLRRHYESYNRIILRLLEPVKITGASLANSRVAGQLVERASFETVRPAAIVPGESSLGVALSAAARVRFKRLKDMIDLYALSEVEEYIKQKDSLVAMNFSLIAIKQSTDVERLTRVTLLLTKATCLFLPVSFLTGYFDITLSGTEYTVAQFWIAFTVVLVLSVLALFAFGAFSESMQTAEVWRGVRRGFRRLMKKID
ncbi:uncharacterized protein K489DRAFT_313649 [Dissoconium aciculare CBS 342.82]|uniref:ADP-ribosylation factor n=1 Tax=Dissoconium aciculare CBS 342.82 TaxID=1314786 RepID=A0A6J3MFG9_9PEZI|nr:uncharacterized protein K489DRAFT_313649 [Dissoconium aciculare CBS 342.82]KAF1826399.1 hypothetical protein K489DRAFT_313649 [Dissoconium aciculare CBS 342.82]